MLHQIDEHGDRLIVRQLRENKKRRQIINRAYQQQADNIVGKLTIKALDDELLVAENTPDTGQSSPFCPGQL